MSLRTKLVSIAACASAAAALVGFAPAADAATTGGTTTTFTLTAGNLAITTPSSKDLGSVATGSASTGAQLGAVSVTDGRGGLNAAWTTSVSSTDFTTGSASADETIAKANADYWSGLATGSTGTGVFTPGQATALLKQTLASSRTAFAGSVLIGNNSATWNPTVGITIPAQAVAGVYSGTITHSVA